MPFSGCMDRKTVLAVNQYWTDSSTGTKPPESEMGCAGGRRKRTMAMMLSISTPPPPPPRVVTHHLVKGLSLELNVST
jgi:hypothetical protein